MAIAMFGGSMFAAPAAHAYNYSTHSRIAELAVRAMRTAPAVGTPLFFPPSGEEALYQQYLAEARASAARFAQLKTGLLPKLQDSSLNVVPDQGDTTSYPFWTASGTQCDLLQGEARDLNHLEKFRIADLNYYPLRSGPCGIEVPSLKAGKNDGTNPQSPDEVRGRVTELVLGFHAGAVDDHVNDTVLWIRPSSAGYFGIAWEALSLAWEYGVGAFLAPFSCIAQVVMGRECEPLELTRQYNPVDQIQGALPGVGDIRDGLFTGLWHFEAVDAGINRFNDTRGMWYPGAGHTRPGALDVAAGSGAQMVGLSLNAYAAEGTTHYGDFDKVHRTGPQWQAHSIGVLEFSPLHNLAAYGWSSFNQSPGDASSLGWPLHAIGDACAPQHVIGSSAWGHRPYEDYISGHEQGFLPHGVDAQGAPNVAGQKSQDDQLARALFAGYARWKKFRQGEDMSGFIHDLAVETRQAIKDQGEWPFVDDYSTDYLTDKPGATARMGANVIEPHHAAAQQLLENAISATIAMLTVAGTKVPLASRDAIDCPPNQRFQFTPGIDVTTPECTSAPPGGTTGLDLSAVGVGQISHPLQTCAQTSCSVSADCAITERCIAGCCEHEVN